MGENLDQICGAGAGAAGTNGGTGAVGSIGDGSVLVTVELSVTVVVVDTGGTFPFGG